MPSEELITRARAALGGEARLRGLHSLSATGELRRAFPDRERRGALDLKWLAPDRFRQVETMQVDVGVKVSVTGAFDGERAWKRSAVEAGGLPLSVTRGGGTELLGDGEQRQMREGFARYLPSLLLSPATPARLEDAGTADVDGVPARVLRVRAAGGFDARLYLDPKTHLPLMLSYRGRPPLITVDARGGAEGSAAPETELRIRFADYREAGGLLWPHRVTTEAGGRRLEELEVKFYQVNPAEINPQSFGR
ncbi:MAG: hypothetical protein JOZ96_20700 [Acidobacteria bacterium]|nr:hypothetical protein [Acidobacteriota bacterium]